MQKKYGTIIQNKTAYNERFGATAAGSAALKGNAGKPPLRQAAIPLAVMRGQQCVRTATENKVENKIQFDR